MKKLTSLLMGAVIIALLNASMCSAPEERTGKEPFSGVLLVGVVLEEQTGDQVNADDVHVRNAQQHKKIFTVSKQDLTYEATVDGNQKYLMYADFSDAQLANVCNVGSTRVQTNFEKERLRDLKGMKLDVLVLDKSGRPMEGAKVVCGHYFHKEVTLSTDSTGHAMFDDFLTNGTENDWFDNVVTVYAGNEVMSNEFSSFKLSDNCHVLNTFVVE